jgi:hypothetical protein
MTIQAAMEAHIAEHLAFAYRRQIEEQLGAPLPNPDEQLPEDVEVELSRLVAQAAQKLNAKDSAEIQQQQNEQQQQDPLIQMQQQELQIKQQDSQAKAQKMLADHELEQQKLQASQALDQQKLELEKAKLELEKAKMDVQQKLAGVEYGYKSVIENKKLDSEMQRTQAQQLAEGLKFGAEQEHRKQDRAQQKELAELNKKESQKPKEE